MHTGSQVTNSPNSTLLMKNVLVERACEKKTHTTHNPLKKTNPEMYMFIALKKRMFQIVTLHASD